MTRIKLDPIAARAVSSSLASANLSFDVPQCNCFEGHDSQSKMMTEFEKRVREVRRLVDKYQELLTNDVSALDSACTAIILQDNAMSLMHQMLGKGAANGGRGK